MKILGTIFLVVGLIALVITGMDYINDSETFSFLGLDVAVSKGNATPVIVSALVFIVGLVITLTSRKK